VTNTNTTTTLNVDLSIDDIVNNINATIAKEGKKVIDFGDNGIAHFDVIENERQYALDYRVYTEPKYACLKTTQVKTLLYNKTLRLNHNIYIIR
jgi:hypothetical protein